MAAISWPWYNCSYTMAAQPIKSLELHYTMIQFFLLLSYNDNLLRRKRKNRTLNPSKPFLMNLYSQRQCNFTREKSTSSISNFFFDVALLMMTSPLFLCFKVYYFTINSLWSAVCGLQSAVCGLQSANVIHGRTRWRLVHLPIILSVRKPF